jgi:mannose-6-phosphate isomerase-like protein (cupin superfamily)
MKIIRNNQKEEHKNSDTCTAYEYPLGDKDLNVAVIELTGRYPEKGSAVNLECKEVAYVLNGSGKLWVKDEMIELNQGDMVLIEANEKFYWEGVMTLIMPCAPAWYPEQHKETE